jgi:diguanylate cyclase (GGDEF)-like protein
LSEIDTGEDGYGVCDLTQQRMPLDVFSVAVRRGFSACWPVPILSSDDEFHGMLIVFSRTVRPPTAREQSFLHLIKELAGATIEHRSLNGRMYHQALHDGLTGLPNRNLMDHDLSHAIGESARSGVPVAFLNINLDKFHSINDAFGYETGDSVLVQVSKKLRGCLPTAGILGHAGGDEFGMVLGELKSVGDAAVMATEILEALSQPFDVAGRELRITASIGISVYPQDGHDGPTVRKNAEAAMCRAKDRGRNRYEFYLPTMNAAAREKIELAGDLRRAIEQNELELYYQPQVSIGGDLVGFEALLRWRHPTRGYIPPTQFIPIAEESGLIVTIGEWVLLQACRQCKAWQAVGSKSVRIAVNVSAVQFAQPDFLEMVARAMEQYDVAPNCLELELTESLLVRDNASATVKLRALRAAGVRIAIDDFGTGYSSLAYLQQLPIDSLKIDRSFVSSIPADASTNHNSTAIVRAVAALALELGLSVTAEGVETPEQQQFLRDIGCHQLQGHLFGKAQTASSAQTLLQVEPDSARKPHQS